ncbi:hypothetical protein [Methylobacterium sp. Leaf465]|uniref:hypothetical protein n=1 Tax=Methylobacterium sp. Leaf465 TaxID=1736385 RepID=UPI0006FE2866|nr:hypothetical protein [Methylobacterium sp. Leaf465]
MTKRQCWNTSEIAETALQPASLRNGGMRKNEISVALSETLVCDGVARGAGDEFSLSAEL